MEDNRRTYDGNTFTLPSPELYPFQWLWDSCFHAIIYTHFDIDAAKAELRAACSHPLPSGLLPHIVYWGDDTAVTNWGREMRGNVITDAWGVDGTSAITQPPIMAMATWRVYECDHDESFLRELYPVLTAHYDHLLEHRLTRRTGLAFIINPDESGEDNSPRFDAAQELPPHHSADQNLDRRIARMQQNATCNFEAQPCMAQHFAVADVPFNVLLAESLRYLARIAAVLGNDAVAAHYDAQQRALTDAMRAHFASATVYHSHDARTGMPITVDTWAMFMPLYGGFLSQHDAANLVESHLLDTSRFWLRYPVPSTAQTEPSFDPKTGFWRGPVWMAPNWFIYHGLRRYGFHEIADELKQKSVRLLERSGFREQYDPLTGDGIGAHNFTWGGLVLDMK